MRQDFAGVLDIAEAGQGVIIERRGVRYRLTKEKAPKRAAPIASRIEWVDPRLIDGEWTWDWSHGGLEFKS